MNVPSTPGTTQDGRIHWLTVVPVQWRMVPSKWLFAEQKELAREGDQQLSATQAYGVIPQEEFERLEGRQVVHVQLHLEKRKHVEVDDFVIPDFDSTRAHGAGFSLQNAHFGRRPDRAMYEAFRRGRRWAADC